MEHPGYWRNLGARFMTEGGVRVNKGDIFRGTYRDIAMRINMLEPVPDHEITAMPDRTHDHDVPEHWDAEEEVDGEASE